MIFADLEVKINTKNGNEILLLKRSPKDGYEKTVLVTGVFHGDEPDGEYLINRYLSERSDTKNRLLFIPCLNPDGLAEKTRTNASGVDLNRNFPAKNWEKSAKDEYFGGDEANSEAETRFLVDLINKNNFDAIITIHAPYKIINYDGDAYNLAYEISKICYLYLKISY